MSAATPINANHVPSPSSWKHTFQAWLRRDGLVILFFLIATLVMTYPLVLKMDGRWLAMADIDTFVKLWDNWWLGNRLFAGEPLFYSRDMFYPVGVDLSYHSISWTVALGSWLMARFVGDIVAYNLTIFIAIFTTGYAAYLMINSLVKHRAAAWLGGLIYTFAPYHLAHTGGHPDLVHLASIPLAILLLGYALNRQKPWAALVAALMVGLAAFTSLYIMIFALLTILAVFVWSVFEKDRWRDRRFWSVVLVFCVACAIFLTARLVPVFRNGQALTTAIEAKYSAFNNQTDLLSYVLPSPHNPLFRPFVERFTNQFRMNARWPAYLGLVPLALTVVALTWRKRRRQVIPWFLAGLLFVILGLGPVLRFNGQVYESIRLPAAAISWFPPIRAVGRPDFFVLGVLLPLAVCAAYGLDRLLSALDDHRLAKLGLALALTLLLLFEFWNGPYPLIPAGQNPFFEQLAHEEGDFAIIDLPMGRQKSKRAIYSQTVHQRPIAEGVVARTPDEAYGYIDNNYLLSLWRGAKVFDCATQPGEDFQFALDQLVSDGFRYIIIRKDELHWERFAAYLPVEPVHQDGQLLAYRLTDVAANPPCSQAGS